MPLVLPEPAVERTAAPPVVVASAAEARRWNRFELQHAARATAGHNPDRDDEIGYLLLYLRDFADASGDLSTDSDPFVRESVPELVALR